MNRVPPDVRNEVCLPARTMGSLDQFAGYTGTTVDGLLAPRCGSLGHRLRLGTDCSPALATQVMTIKLRYGLLHMFRRQHRLQP